MAMENELYTKINKWFSGKMRDNISPSNTVVNVYNDFLDVIENKKLHLNVRETDFLRKLCAATCNYYHASLTCSEPGGPRKLEKYPNGWDDEIEQIWIDYLYSRHFTTTFWNHFWNKLRPADWECDHERWRYYIQSLLPLYIERDIELLKEDGLIYEDDEGNFLSAEDYIPYAEEETY